MFPSEKQYYFICYWLLSRILLLWKMKRSDKGPRVTQMLEGLEFWRRETNQTK